MHQYKYLIKCFHVLYAEKKSQGDTCVDPFVIDIGSPCYKKAKKEVAKLNYLCYL